MVIKRKLLQKEKEESKKKIEIDSREKSKFWLMGMREKQNKNLLNYIQWAENYALMLEISF